MLMTVKSWLQMVGIVTLFAVMFACFCGAITIWPPKMSAELLHKLPYAIIAVPIVAYAMLFDAFVEHPKGGRVE